MRSLDGLFNADWLDDDTVIGALINGDGEVETAHIDLPDGDLVADGLIVDPIPDGAGLDHRQGTHARPLPERDGRDARTSTT